MTPADPLTPEEVERLDPETRRYYSGANSRDESMWPTVLIVNRVWLRDHIIRAARMEAFIEAARHVFGPQSSREVPAMPNEAALSEFMKTYIDDFSDRWDECERLFSAVVPPERSK